MAMQALLAADANRPCTMKFCPLRVKGADKYRTVVIVTTRVIVTTAAHKATHITEGSNTVLEKRGKSSDGMGSQFSSGLGLGWVPKAKNHLDMGWVPNAKKCLGTQILGWVLGIENVISISISAIIFQYLSKYTIGKIISKLQIGKKLNVLQTLQNAHAGTISPAHITIALL